MAAVPLPQGHLRSLRRRQERRALAQGAGGALLGFVLVVVTMLQGPRWWDRWQADYVTDVGQVAQVTLPDGSLASLNSDTALRIDFSGSTRRVEVLRGEAFFEVEHDPAHPFIAYDDSLTARAVGTRYGVRHGDDGQGSEVTVEQGRVAVALRSHDETELTAGQQAQAVEDGAAAPQIVVRTVDADRTLSWRQGVLVFSHRPLRDVLDDLGRYRPGAIVLLDQEIGALPVSGVFDLHDVDGALASIEQRLPVRVTVVADRLVLVTAKAEP
jgi:transmembrane sensor